MIKNISLREAICDELGISEEELDAEQLEEVEELEWADLFNSYTLDGIDKLTELRKLSIRFMENTDIDPIYKLKKLQELSFGDSEINSLEGIEELTELRELCIAYAKVSDIKPIFKLPKLQRLSLYHIKIDTLDGIEKLTELKELVLNNLKVTDISAIKNMKNLTELKMDWNLVKKLFLHEKNSTKLIYAKLADLIFKHKEFAQTQIEVCKEFLLNPSKETAKRVMTVTPKANLFIDDFLSEEEISECIKEVVSSPKASIRYIEEALEIYPDMVEEFITDYGSHHIKLWFMEKELKCD